MVSWNDAAEMNERVCKRRLGDAQQDRLALCRTSAFGRRLVVGLIELGLVDMFALQQRGVAAILDLPLLQHLTHDHFDVLVVDLHALQSIDVLHFVDHVVGQRLDTHDRRMSCGAGLPSMM